MNKNHTSVVVVVVVDVAQAENAVYDNSSTIKKNMILISRLAEKVHTMYVTIHILLYEMSSP
jgi:hypothetical protein